MSHCHHCQGSSVLPCYCSGSYWRQGLTVDSFTLGWPLQLPVTSRQILSLAPHPLVGLQLAEEEAKAKVMGFTYSPLAGAQQSYRTTPGPLDPRGPPLLHLSHQT